MRILFVHAIGKSKFGGGEKWVVSAAAGLRDRGHHVVVGGRGHSQLLQVAREAGLETVNFNILSDISPYHVFRIARFMCRHQTDVVITRGTNLAIVGLAARMAGNPPVIVRHGLPLMSRIRKHLFLMRNLADGIITNTQSIKAHYESNNWLPPGFTRVVYNGTVACGNTGNGGNAEAIPAERFPGKRVVLAVGRLARQKGYHDLIDAIALLKGRYNNLLFVILGSGKLLGRLRAHARRRGVEHLIRFEGFVRDVSPYLRECELFVLTSLYEGMPNAAMEAMAHGKPVILTNVNGAPELIPDKEKGVLVPPRCPRTIADSMIRLLENPQLRHKMGCEARAHVAGNFPMKTMVEEMEAYLLEMVDKKPGGRN